jgi:hypothetical protein
MILFPRAPLEVFEYGFRLPKEIAGNWARQTEQLAFIRTKDIYKLRHPAGTGNREPLSQDQLDRITLLLRGSLASQHARFELNGKRTEMSLSESNWTEVPTDEFTLEENVLEIGIISTPILPESFPESWGAGAYIAITDEH